MKAAASFVKQWNLIKISIDYSLRTHHCHSMDTHCHSYETKWMFRWWNFERNGYNYFMSIKQRREALYIILINPQSDIRSRQCVADYWLGGKRMRDKDLSHGQILFECLTNLFWQPHVFESCFVSFSTK